MADANEMHETIMRELKNVVICDTDQTEEELESVLYDEDADFQDFPPSLLRYFETSKSRGAVFEKLIREEPEAEITASHHTEDMMNCHIEADKDMMTPNEQVICGSENEENNTSTDIRPLPAPTETESLFTHNVSVCPNNEDEAGTNKHMESERHLAFEMRMPNKSIDYEAEQDKQKSKEMNEEQKTQIERDFQRELRKIMDAEKRHQKELELMEKRAQEKLEQEFSLQQEVISNLQRRVEEERRMREDEQKRMKDEKDKRKREEEKLKMEAERRRMVEETRRKKEEDRKIEMKRKKEEERKNKEEEMKRMAREEKKREEDGRKKIELQKKKLEDEMRMIEEEEMRKKKEEVERIKREEERGKREEEIKKIGEAREEWEKMEKQKREMEEQSVKEEDEWRKKDGKERKKMEKENMGIEEEGRVTKEIKERKKQEQMREKNENDEADDRKEVALEKMYEEMGKGDKREQGKVDELKLEERKMKNENYSKKMKEEVKKKEMERKKMEEKNDGKEVVRKQEGEHRKIKEMRSNEEDEKRKFEDERETKEEEQRRLQKETRRQKDDEDDRKAEEEMRLHTDDNEGYVDNRKTKDTEKKNEKSKNGNAEKEKNEEEVGEKKEEVNEKMQEEMRLKEKEIKMRMVQNRENEVRVIRANEVQKKLEDDGIIGQNESVVQPETSSQTEDSTTCTSSSPGPLQSTICPTTNEAMPPQYDKNICQTSTDETVDCENQAAKPSSGSVRLAACLSEHTEQKRLSWMKDCIPWSDLSLQNRRKHRVPAWSKRGPRRAAEASSLLPLSPGSLLQSTSWKSLQEVTTVTLEDLPGCSLSTLAQCPQLQSLSLRRCGLKSLEGLNQLQQLCYIDVQENDISYVDCENMPSLRVLHLSHNKLTSVHGLAGAGNLDVLELSHNSITRIAGLESMRRLQRLSVDHNQLISTKGLKDVYTLLHLNCSHNHLARVEGLENNALLNTLDLRANSLTEPPSLNNQVLLRELYLDDNSISSLQGLAACWLPLMQHLSVAQNRITQLPPVSDALSLSNLDLRFNCMSELQNVCESLEGCQFLREILLTGNPLQQENDWRSSLQRAVPGLRAIDDQETDSYLSPPAVQQVGSASDSFLMFCQAQIQETRDLQRRHRRELSNVSSSLDAVKISCRHFTETLQLATDQRFAHEYGDTTVADKHRTADQTAPEETLDVESTGKASPFTPNSDRIGCSYQTFDEKPVVESWHDIFDTGPKTVPTVSKASSGSLHSLAMKNKTSSNLEMAPVSNYQDLDLKNTAAVVIQQRWRKYRQKCENLSSPITAEKGGGGGGEPESGPPYINRRVVGQDYAATVIQAFWRGFTLRRRLTSALAAVTCLDTGGDDTFEEVDINEFVFDEAELENNWTLPLSEDSPPRYYPVSERPLHLKPPGPFPEPSQYILSPPVVWQAKQAWVAPEQVDSCVQRVSPVSSNRSSSPASASVVSRLSERSEKILEEWGFTHSHTALLMLKRAQRMKAKKQHQKKHRDPSIHLASFRHHSCQPGKVEVRNRQAQDNRNYIKAHTLFQPPSSIQNEIQPHQTSVLMSEGHEAGEAELGPGQAEKQQEGAHSDSESVHFLPEISPDILNGGRVQLVADPGYAECLHHASGLRANSSLAGQPSKESDYPHRNSLSHGTEKVPSPKQATSAPSKRERISFRDNPVRMSGGWGGGKKRNKI